jgi:GT2 family glycosyltransferase
MNKPSLSYVITSFNKVDFLKMTLPRLIENTLPDEEIIIIDGGSTDGTKDYLNALLVSGKIKSFISEKDCGEAHGFNKALFLANADIIKIITDDDIYDFSEIQICKSFMQANEQIDLLASDTLKVDLIQNKELSCKHIQTPKYDFIDWQNGKRKNTFFTGLTLMIRKSSLSYLGLFNTYFKMVDIEYCVRVTSIKANIAYYPKPLVLTIVNQSSNSNKFSAQFEKEQVKISFMYEYFNHFLSNNSYYNPYSIKDSGRYFWKLLSNRFFMRSNYLNKDYFLPSENKKPIDQYSMIDLFNTCKNILTDKNKAIGKLDFLIKINR